MFGTGSAKAYRWQLTSVNSPTPPSYATYTSKTTLAAKWWTVARSRIESNVREVAYGRIR